MIRCDDPCERPLTAATRPAPCTKPRYFRGLGKCSDLASQSSRRSRAALRSSIWRPSLTWPPLRSRVLAVRMGHKTAGKQFRPYRRLASKGCGLDSEPDTYYGLGGSVGKCRIGQGARKSHNSRLTTAWLRFDGNRPILMHRRGAGMVEALPRVAARRAKYIGMLGGRCLGDG